jgi:hypothetical protein
MPRARLLALAATLGACRTITPGATALLGPRGPTNKGRAWWPGICKAGAWA